MHNKLAFAGASVCFLVLFALVIWQGSFSFGSYGPTDLRQAGIFWAVSTVIFLLFVTVGFMLFRTAVKLYFERRTNQEGSRIRSKLIAGALVLALTPALFSVLFSVYVLNRNLDKWFSQPARSIELNLRQVESAYTFEWHERARAVAKWISLLPETSAALAEGSGSLSSLQAICKSQEIAQLALFTRDDKEISVCKSPARNDERLFRLDLPISVDGTSEGRLQAAFRMSPQLSEKQASIVRYLDQQRAFAENRKFYKNNYILLICLISLFVLFVASWISQILARQIIVPISALLEAAREVRQGNLAFRVNVKAMDELALLVRSFNDMTKDLEGNAKELEARRRFTEAILESIPTAVFSVAEDGRIERTNRAFQDVFPNDLFPAPLRLEDLFGSEFENDQKSNENLEEIRYLMKRARRTGSATSQLELRRSRRILLLSITVASLEQRRGFVIVAEDTSEILRAQKATAWQEVARRIAHEIKNPLTPISLCADRMERRLNKASLPEDLGAVLLECTNTIQQEVQTVKTLVDEFSQFSRFPAAQPALIDLNDVVDSALAVFAGRLTQIAVTREQAMHLPLVMADREQIKRVVVNLIDNAAEAMENVPVRSLLVKTAVVNDTVELIVADTGIGVSPEEREKLFLPYFSTKGRGTGLGLAIVSHIIAEHRGRVRVEDNSPAGTRFIVEFVAYTSTEGEAFAGQETIVKPG